MILIKRTPPSPSSPPPMLLSLLACNSCSLTAIVFSFCKRTVVVRLHCILGLIDRWFGCCFFCGVEMELWLRYCLAGHDSHLKHLFYGFVFGISPLLSTNILVPIQGYFIFNIWSFCATRTASPTLPAILAFQAYIAFPLQKYALCGHWLWFTFFMVTCNGPWLYFFSGRRCWECLLRVQGSTRAGGFRVSCSALSIRSSLDRSRGTWHCYVAGINITELGWLPVYL